MADRFEIHYLKFKTDTVHIGLTNTKFRSNAQATGRVTSTLQRFTSDAIKFAKYLSTHKIFAVEYFE